MELNISFRKAGIEDAELLANLYNQSFYADYIRFGQCPGYGKTKESMEKSLPVRPKHIIMINENPVGALSFENTKINEYYIGCICIIPEFQGKGIGTAAFNYILSLCKDWKRINLVTPQEKRENILFYTQKCGMQLGETNIDENIKITELYLER